MTRHHRHHHASAPLDAQAIADQVTALTESGHIRWGGTASRYQAVHERIVFTVAKIMHMPSMSLQVITEHEDGSHDLDVQVEFTRSQARQVRAAVRAQAKAGQGIAKPYMVFEQRQAVQREIARQEDERRERIVVATVEALMAGAGAGPAGDSAGAGAGERMAG